MIYDTEKQFNVSNITLALRRKNIINFNEAYTFINGLSCNKTLFINLPATRYIISLVHSNLNSRTKEANMKQQGSTVPHVFLKSDKAKRWSPVCQILINLENA